MSFTDRKVYKRPAYSGYVTYYPILYPEASQHLFHVPRHFDDRTHMLTDASLIQAPHHWRTGLCRHDITIRNSTPYEVPLDWRTHRSPAGYSVSVTRGVGSHRCGTAYDDLLVDRVLSALIRPKAERPDVAIEIDGRTTRRHFSIVEPALRRRRFARLVEDLVHDLAPDFYVTGVDLSSATFFEEDENSEGTS